MPAQINYKHLHYFWMIAREGSISAASQVLNLSPQTMSSQLADFEHAMGGLLFLRKGRKLQLSPLGKEIYTYAEEMFRIGEEMKRAVDNAVSRKHIVLNVGVSASIHKLLAYQLIRPALELESEVALNCVTGSPDYLLSELLRFELDVVLSDRLPELQRDQHYHWYEVGSSSISLFAAPELAAQITPDFPQSLHGKPFLSNARAVPYLNQLLQWFETRGIRPELKAHVDDSALVKVFAAHGMGVFAAPTVISEEVCRQYQVEKIGTVDAVSETLYAICRGQHLSNLAVEAICRAGLDQR